jgi:sortase (surface protein transpeptidase)
MTSPSRTLRGWAYWCTSAIAIAVALVAILGHTSPKEPSVPNIAVLSTASEAHARITTFPAIPRSGPEKLEIPALGVNIAVGRLGLQPDGEVEVPATTHTVGWFDDGATPGQIGSAVILGHVDSYLGPGIFFELKTLKANDVIIVTLANGTVTRFRVNKVVQYAKTGFPDRLVFGSHGTRSLQLVTCGGPFDSATGHYLANIVVFSRLVSVSTPKR